MLTLSIDIETYSPIDLKSRGVYRYVDDPEFTILMMAYRIDDDPIRILDLTWENIPGYILDALTDRHITKTAFNAQFEMVCLEKYTGLRMSPMQWDCTMVRAAMAGLPLSLEAVAKVLDVEGKLAAGKSLINYFSKPCKPTKVNGGRTRNLPDDDPDKWELFMDYCVQDVRVEGDIRDKLIWFEPTPRERKVWYLDHIINTRGVLIDQTLVRNAVKIDTEHRDLLTDQATDITGMDNANSVAQLKSWLEDQLQDEEISTLNKEAIRQLLTSTDQENVIQTLQLRQEMAKTSVRKYTKMLDTVCSDGRVRGMIQYYGANRTGRWAGRFIQLQNLPQNHLADLETARQITIAGDRDALAVCYGNVPSTLSELIRTAFVAPEGYILAVADFSSIEARVIAWLAGEKWRLEVFATHGKIYEASASQMFKVPLEEITKGSPLRQKGKVAELALGYQGGVGALSKMDTRGDIPDEEKQGIIDQWRRASPSIVRLWRTCEEAAIAAVENSATITINRGVKFIGTRGALLIELPSGRRLTYVKPRLCENRFGRLALQHASMDQVKRTWVTNVDTYGGKLVENIVQAIARDCLAEAMLNLYEAGYKIVMHIHDEVVCEVPVDGAEETLKQMCTLMSRIPPWGDGIPLKADGYLTPFYRKD